jgi:hypothetical protein
MQGYRKNRVVIHAYAKKAAGLGQNAQVLTAYPSAIYVVQSALSPRPGAPNGTMPFRHLYYFKNVLNVFSLLRRDLPQP